MFAATGKRRRRRRWITVGLITVVVAWGGYLAVSVSAAYRHDERGLAELQYVRSTLSPGDATSARTVQRLRSAERDFAGAGSDLSSPLFAPLTIVPVIGRQFRSIRALSTAAGTVSSVGASFLSKVSDVVARPHDAGPERVTSLRRLAALSRSAANHLSAIDTGPSAGLVSPLARKYDLFVAQLDDARSRLVKAAGVASAVGTILQGPQSYLVLASNNAEMRAGSGAFLDVGVASTRDGSVKLGDLGPSGDLTLPLGRVKVTGDLEDNWGWLHPGVDWRNLGLTPQFDVNAPLAARMWAADTGQKVDGVLELDVAGLRQLMEASGPVEVSGFEVTAGTVEQYLLHDQYEGLADNAATDDGRQDKLGGLASAVLRKLQGQSTDLRALGTAVSSAVAGRHLMMWSSNPKEQAVWVASGVSGGLVARSVDVAVINQGGNKLDQYLAVHVSVTTRASGSHTDVTMTTRLENGTPNGQSEFIAGPFPGVPVKYGGYTGLVAANLPGRASHITMTGAGPLAVKGGDGPTWVVAAPVTIAQGASSTVVVRFELPGRHGTMSVVPSARVPAEQWTAGDRKFDDGATTTVSW